MTSYTNRYIKNILNVENEINEISIEQYIKIVDKLEYLAYRTNAWYGVLEARNLLKSFKENSELMLESEFEDKIAPILYEYSKYRRKNDPLIIENEGLETKKQKLQKVLSDAFEAVKEEEEIDINNLGLDLEDAEYDS